MMMGDLPGLDGVSMVMGDLPGWNWGLNVDLAF